MLRKVFCRLNGCQRITIFLRCADAGVPDAECHSREVAGYRRSTTRLAASGGYSPAHQLIDYRAAANPSYRSGQPPLTEPFNIPPNTFRSPSRTNRRRGVTPLSTQYAPQLHAVSQPILKHGAPGQPQSR